MELSAIQEIARSLHVYGVRYVVVGGMAVVAHGYGRMTFDLDLVLKLDPDNILKAFASLAEIGYQPRAPVSPEQFADPAIRHQMIREKGLMVLNLWSERHPGTMVDLFVAEPFNFEQAERDALLETLEDGTSVRFVGLRTLIEMEKNAGREKDLDDVRHLEAMADEA